MEPPWPNDDDLFLQGTGRSRNAADPVISQTGVAMKARTAARPRTSSAQTSIMRHFINPQEKKHRVNHLQENKRKLRQLQSEKVASREPSRAATASSAQRRPSSTKYSHVESKLAKMLKDPRAAPGEAQAKAPPQKNFVAANREATRGAKGPRPSSKHGVAFGSSVRPASADAGTRNRTSNPASRPSSAQQQSRHKQETNASELALSLSGVHVGERGPAQAKVQRPSSAAHAKKVAAASERLYAGHRPASAGLSDGDTTRLPAYLRRRKKEWEREEEAKRRSQPDPECPPGHFLLDAAKKSEILTKLQEKHADLLAELHNMPMSRDTLRMRQRKEVLDRELSETEEAIRYFSRPKVYVPLPPQ